MKEGLFVFIMLLAIAGCIAYFASERQFYNEVDRLQYVIKLRETELRKLQFEYEMLAQECARFKADVARDSINQ